MIWPDSTFKTWDPACVVLLVTEAESPMVG